MAVDIKPKYLTLDEQQRLASSLSIYVDDAPTEKVLYMRNCTNFMVVPTVANAVYCWHAGFRGYGLAKFGRGRLYTLFVPFLGAVASRSYTDLLAQAQLYEPFRPESALRFGFLFASVYQIAHMSSLVAGPVMTFFWAAHNGILTIPVDKVFFGMSVNAFNQFFVRLKPWRNGMLFSWAASTSLAFAIGAVTYNQSCKVLSERFNRRTLSLDES